MSYDIPAKIKSVSVLIYILVNAIQLQRQIKGQYSGLLPPPPLNQMEIYFYYNPENYKKCLKSSCPF